MTHLKTLTIALLALLGACSPAVGTAPPVPARDAAVVCWPPCGAAERCTRVISVEDVRLLCCGEATGCRVLAVTPLCDCPEGYRCEVDDDDARVRTCVQRLP